jgi:16S rRNA (uracil1498-N3)-methyltransferase
MRRRFFVEQFAGDRAVIEGETAHHLGRVLRAQAGQLYELSDGKRLWLGRIERAARDRVEFALVEELSADQPTLEITLLLSIVKFDAFEWALEKATELGVSRIVPLAAARCEKALVAAAGKRAARWYKILTEASRQSRRLQPPQLQSVARPEQAFSAVTANTKLLLSERREAPPLRQVLSGATPAKALALAIGPEGGWTEQEFAAGQTAGFREASLGKLILRAETAVIAALASLNYALNE